MSERWHGTAGGYTYHRCRCDECRGAWAAYKRVYLRSYRDKMCAEPCTTPDCPRKQSRAYAGSGLCEPCWRGRRDRLIQPS